MRQGATMIGFGEAIRNGFQQALNVRGGHPAPSTGGGRC